MTIPLDRIEVVARESQDHDGAPPLDEATWLTLRHHPERVQAWVEDDGFALVRDAELSLVVRPDARGRGLGRALLTRALNAVGQQQILAWSHGDHPAAAALATAYSFDRVRDLWVMRRPVGGLPPVTTPPGVEIRAFRPDDPNDAQAVLRVNAAAFAAHPEQRAMDEANLRERMSQEWFDPAGLLLATQDGEVVGFHWTKRHSPEVGEVYVLGIAPPAQGNGLGRALTLAGLHHLYDGGAREVHLYVESENRPAIAVYAGLGFTHAPVDTHVQYRRAAR